MSLREALVAPRMGAARGELVLTRSALARLASTLFLVGGVIGAAANLTLDLAAEPWELALAPAAAVIGLVSWFLPWHRLPRLAPVWPVPVALAFIVIPASLNALDPHSYGAFFTLIFAWLGITQRRWTCAALAAPAGALYVLPLLITGAERSSVLSVALVVPICALVGEALSWVTGRLRLVESDLLNALKVKDNFLDMTSHELRTPLTAIVGFSSIMLNHWDSITDEQRTDCLQRIERCGWSLTQMVDNLLAVARERHGSLKARPSLFSLGEFVEKLSQDYSEPSLPIEVCVPQISVMADREYLAILLRNFLSNAKSYGKPPIRIEAKESSYWVEIVVSDCGDGVPPDFVPEMFDKFTQVNSGSVRTAKGLGLGLAIANSLASVQQGEVFYQPNRPTGSRFGVRIPKNWQPGKELQGRRPGEGDGEGGGGSGAASWS